MKTSRGIVLILLFTMFAGCSNQRQFRNYRAFPGQRIPREQIIPERTQENRKPVSPEKNQIVPESDFNPGFQEPRLGPDLEYPESRRRPSRGVARSRSSKPIAGPVTSSKNRLGPGKGYVELPAPSDR